MFCQYTEKCNLTYVPTSKIIIIIMKKLARSSKMGFTIVELLIVVVIIAILAAITIVSYNGMQTRARETSTLTDLSSIAKQIELYAATNGSYPNSVATAKSIDAKTSINYGSSRVLLCATANTGFAVFIYDSSLGRQYTVQSSQSPRQVTPLISWSAASICGTTPYAPVAWGDYWLAT